MVACISIGRCTSAGMAYSASIKAEAVLNAFSVPLLYATVPFSFEGSFLTTSKFVSKACDSYSARTNRMAAFAFSKLSATINAMG